MKTWLTEIMAIDHRTGELKKWAGENVVAMTHDKAQQWCNENKGYLTVTGELVAEIPCKPGTFEPDFDKMIEYDNSNTNSNTTIKSGETFVHTPTGKRYECIGTDEGKVWYIPDGETESKSFDPAECLTLDDYTVNELTKFAEDREQ